MITQVLTPILAIDYGDKNTGFALALDLHQPMFLKEKAHNKEDLLQVIEKYKPRSIVFGLPINVQNKRQSDKVKSVAGYVKSRVGQVKIYFQDERFTSKMADTLLKYGISNYSSEMYTVGNVDTADEYYLHGNEASHVKRTLREHRIASGGKTRSTKTAKRVDRTAAKDQTAAWIILDAFLLKQKMKDQQPGK